MAAYQVQLRRASFYLTFACAIAPLCSIAASHILLGAAFAALLLSGETLRLPPIKLPLALFVSGTLLSLLLSGHIQAGYPQVRKFYVFLILVCVTTAIRRLETVRDLLLWWIAGATCSSLWALVQFARKSLAVHDASGDFYRYYVAQRITGFMSHWMTYSGQMMIVLLFLAAFLMFSDGRRRWLWPLAACAAVISCGLVLGLTRGVWIGTAVGACYLMWQWKRKSLIALPAAAAIVFFAAPAAVRERVTSAVRPRGEVDSNQHRIVCWRTGLAMIAAHPWFGVGPEQVGKQFNDYVPADIRRPLPDGWYGHLHNIYVQYAAERGIPTLLMLLWLLGKVFRDFVRAAAKAPPGLSEERFILHGCIAALIGTLVTGLFEHNLGDSEVLQMFLTVIALGYAAVGVTPPRSSPSLPDRPA